MSLRNIKADIAAALGSSVLDPTQSVYVTSKINDAAYELYTATDLVGSLFEIITAFDTSFRVIALPSVVDKIRGLRWYSSPYKIKFNDIRPRYGISGFGKQSLNFREIGYQPLAVAISNQSKLFFVLPAKESKDITITVRGATDNSSQVIEDVVIPAGSLEKATENNYVSVDSIRKSDTTKYDIQISDVNDNVLASIPNHQLSSSYLIVQVLEDNVYGTPLQSGIETLFKARYSPMLVDEDEFICPGYDRAIFHKYLELYYATQDGKDNIRDYHKTKCAELIAQRYQDDARGKELLMQFDENKFFGISRKRYWPFRKYV